MTELAPEPAVQEAPICVVAGPLFDEARYAGGWKNQWPEFTRDTYRVSLAVATLRHLAPLVSGGHNGELLVIGYYNINPAVMGSQLGWPVRSIYTGASWSSHKTAERAAIDAVFAEMAAGTYRPRAVFVENKVYGMLTLDQYLFLRDWALAGMTAIYLQLTEDSSTGNSWVAPFYNDLITVHYGSNQVGNVRQWGGYDDWPTYTSEGSTTPAYVNLRNPIYRGMKAVQYLPGMPPEVEGNYYSLENSRTASGYYYPTPQWPINFDFSVYSWFTWTPDPAASLADLTLIESSWTYDAFPLSPSAPTGAKHPPGYRIPTVLMGMPIIAPPLTGGLRATRRAFVG